MSSVEKKIVRKVEPYIITGRNPVAFIGDIHGCNTELEKLITMIDSIYGDISIVSVGDVVDRGPGVHESIQLLKQRNVLMCMGNHEDKLLRWKKGSDVRIGNSQQVSLDAMKEDDWTWIATAKDYIDFPDRKLKVVHAGFIPSIPYIEQPYKTIIRLRDLDLAQAKMLPLGATGGTFWAALWDGPDHIIFGHEAFTNVHKFPRATGIDTACVFGGKLSALIYHDEGRTFDNGIDILSVKAEKRYWSDRHHINDN